MIWHRESISNGVHSDSRPRGLHPGVFGPGGKGWAAVGENILRAIDGKGVDRVMLDHFGGVDPDGTITDTPLDTAASTLPSGWRSYCNADDLEAMLERLNSAGVLVGIYGGMPRSDTPDSRLMQVAPRLELVVMDGTAHLEWGKQAAQRDAYQAKGCDTGYESLANLSDVVWSIPHLVCCATLNDWNVVQFRVRNFGVHPKREVDGRIIARVARYVLLLDRHDNVAGCRVAASEGLQVAVNLSSQNWKRAFDTTE